MQKGEKWILCPVCGAKTRLRLMQKTVLVGVLGMKTVPLEYFGIVERFSVFAPWAWGRPEHRRMWFEKRTTFRSESHFSRCKETSM